MADSNTLKLCKTLQIQVYYYYCNVSLLLLILLKQAVTLGHAYPTATMFQRFPFISSDSLQPFSVGGVHHINWAIAVFPSCNRGVICNREWIAFRFTFQTDIVGGVSLSTPTWLVKVATLWKTVRLQWRCIIKIHLHAVLFKVICVFYCWRNVMLDSLLYTVWTGNSFETNVYIDVTTPVRLLFQLFHLLYPNSRSWSLKFTLPPS